VAKLTKSVVINAPVEKIFDYLDDPNNLPGIWPGMEAVSDVGRLSNGGVCYKYVYKIAGMRLDGYSEDIEHVQNVRTVSKSSGGVDSTATVDFAPEGAGTRVTVVSEYVIPMPVLGKLAEAVVVKLSEQDAEALLANLKKKMEG